MNIMERYKLEQKTYKKVIKNISAIKDKEFYLERLKQTRNRKVQNLQIIALYNMTIVCIAAVMPIYIKMAILLISTTITVYFFFKIVREIQALDKKIHESIKEVISLNKQLVL